MGFLPSEKLQGAANWSNPVSPLIYAGFRNVIIFSAYLERRSQN